MTSKKKDNKLVLAFSGCRHLDISVEEIEEAIPHWHYDEFRVGDATGVDYCITEWARQRGDIALVIYAASKDTTDPDFPVRQASDWDEQGNAAGPIRNAAMVKGAEQLIAFWNGKSRGTIDAVSAATKAGAITTIYPIK